MASTRHPPAPPPATTTSAAAAIGGQPRDNRLLGTLARFDQEPWWGLLEAVTMPLGQVLYESGQQLSHAYFPSSALVSLVYMTEDGASMEIAVVGLEGMVGIPIFMGGGSTPSRAVVLSAGQGFRLPAAALREAFARSPGLARMLLRYTQALVAQMAQIAVCNRHHTLDLRLSRWLLLAVDRLPGPELVVTQELIAQTLGVRREGVTAAARALQQSGLIRYQRGRLQILDRPGLEQRACECYGVVRGEYDRLLT